MVNGQWSMVSFPVQNVYRMVYGDENTTFEPLNGYHFLDLCGWI